MYKGVGGGGGGWETEGGLHRPLGHRQWYCVFSKGQIQVQSTGQRWSSAVVLTQLTSLLMPSRGLTGSVVHLCGFTGSAKSLL